MERYTGVVDSRLAVHGRVSVSGVARAGADVYPGGDLQVPGVIGPVDVADGGRFVLTGVMADDLSADVDASVWLAGIFQGRLIAAPEGVNVAEGALLRVGSAICQVVSGQLRPAPSNIETLVISSHGPWYRWYGDWELSSPG